MMFRDRVEAGEQLARALLARGIEKPVVLGFRGVAWSSPASSRGN